MKKVVLGSAAVALGFAGGFATPGLKPFGGGAAPSASGEAVFAREFARVRYQAVDKSDPVALRDAGMAGMVSVLGDPHTVYFSSEVAKAFNEQTQANFFGVGARLALDPLGARAVKVFEEGPAYSSGLRDNDVINRVNDVPVAGKPTDEIVAKIKGPEGTYVTLTLVRKGTERPITIKIRRARIIIPTVEGKRLANDVGYLAIGQVSEPTAMQFDAELAKLEKSPLKGLVIDVRGNPGGLLQVTAEMLSRFVSDKTVVKMRLKDGHSEDVRTYPGLARKFDYPIAVLQNEDTASAAEIFSGCLRDYGLATLVGTHTYGKASVQNLFQVRDGALAKVTIAKYYLPGGEFIGRKVDKDGVYVSGGLAPTVKSALDLDREPTLGDPKTDSQLERALQVLASKG